MPISTSPRSPASRPRAPFGASLCLLLGLACIAAHARAADAAAGSGSASILPSGDVVAGSTGTWTVTFLATEDFANQGGYFEVDIPAGWTPPQHANPAQAGYVNWTDVAKVDSVAISGGIIRVYLGTPPEKLLAGQAVSVLYGVGGGPASARAQTAAPATAVFHVRSQPAGQTGAVEIASSPSLSVIPGPVTHVRVVDAAMNDVGALSLFAGDTTRFYLRGYDAYDNPARLVSGGWSVTGGIGTLAPASGTASLLTLTTVGTGFAVGDSGSWADSTGAISVSHGAYAGLAVTSTATASAGSAFAASVEARDAPGNLITSGAGSSAAVRFLAYADSTGSLRLDPGLEGDQAVLSSGLWSGTLTARRAGVYWMSARDSVAGFESARFRLAVGPSAPDHLELAPDSLALTAGVPDTVTVRVFDRYENPAPVSADEPLLLWTDRPAGLFRGLAGAQIFGITLPAGADSAQFTFTDTQRTTAAGRIRAIDSNGTLPFLGTGAAPLTTAPAAPAGAIALAAAPDTLVADGVDSTQVSSGVIRDAYGNAVAAGERFTLSAVALTPLTDGDPATPGVQLLADASGRVAAPLRAGTGAGAASVSVVSERGSASGSVVAELLAGPPAGVVPLAAPADSLPADSTSSLVLSASGLVDAHGNTVRDGEAYTVATTLGGIATADADPATPGIQVRALGGAIAFTLFGGDSLGVASVTASSVRGSATGSMPVRLVPGAPSGARSLVAALSPVPVGPGGSVVTVTLRDAQDHPLAGIAAGSIEVHVAGVVATVTALDAAPDPSGVIRFKATATAAGTGTVSAAARGVPLAATSPLEFTHGPLDHYALSGPAGPLTSGTAALLSIAARDAFGNALPDRSGDVLRVLVTSGGAIHPDSVVLAAGAAGVPFTPTLAQPLAMDVRDDSSRAVAYGPVPVQPGAPYRLTALPPGVTTLVAGDSVTATARLSDASGNAVPGGAVAASVVAGSGSVAPTAATTDAAGHASVTLHAGAAPGPLTLRFLATGSAADDSIRADSVSVSVVPGAVAAIQIAAPPAGTAGDSLLVTLTLRDAFGNVATGATPSLTLHTTTPAPSPDHTTWFPGPGASGLLTDAAADSARYDFAAADLGVARLRMRDTRAETVRLRASGASIPVAESADLAIAPAAPAVLALLSGDNQTAVVAHDLAAPLRVDVRDAFGNVVPGASVSFRPVTGNGAVDAVRGGAPDSLALADVSGAATCDVARLGTVAGAGTDVFRAGLPGAPSPQVLFTASASPDTASALSLAPASVVLPPAGAQTVTVTARDLFGNLAPATAVTVYLGTPALGTLESLGPTSGSATTQSGVTDAAGALAVRYRAPASAPAADSLLARGAAIGPVALRAVTQPAATVALRVLPDSLGWTAGVPVRVRVQALDAFGNLVTGDNALVTMQPAGSLAWSPASGPLVAGEFVTFGRDDVAESTPLAASRAGGGTGSAGPVTVRPSDPAGPIPVAATRDSLTADGRSSATLAFGPVHDAFGNVVAAGTLVVASAQQGTLVASDVRADLPGLDLATGADGRASLVVVAAAAPGVDTVRVASRAGNAAGSRILTYTPRPSLAAVAGTIAPTEVLPGGSASFRIQVSNPGPAAVAVGVGTTLSFGTGGAAVTAGLPAAVTVPAGGVATLSFAPTAIPASLTPGLYAPSLRTLGTDGTGESFDFYLDLGGAEVSALGLIVSGVSASPAAAPLGYANLGLVFDVRNPSGSTATLTGASLGFTQGAFLDRGTVPALPQTVPPGNTLRLTASARVPSSGVAPGTLVDATLTVSATFAASTVVAASAPPVTFPVVSAAQLAASPGSATPLRYLRGRTHQPTVRVRNTGAAAVTLARDSTRIALSGPGSTLGALLAANAVVAAGDSATLVFDSLSVSAAVPRGIYAASLVLRGSESGEAYADSIPLDPVGVPVVDPALLSVVAGSFAPDTASAGQDRPIALTLANSGDVDFALDLSTALDLGAPVGGTWPLGGAATVPAGGSVALAFQGGPIGAGAAPGTAAATLAARGREDGVPRAQALVAGSLVLRAPADLAFVAGSTRPGTVTPGSTVDFTVEVENRGGSPVQLDPAAARLLVSDGVDAVQAAAVGAPVTLAPGARLTLSFPAAAIPSALAAQPYAVTLSLQGVEWGRAESATLLSPPGELTVLEPLASIEVRGLDGGAPTQVSPQAFSARVWSLVLAPLAAPGTSVQAVLQQVRLTLLADGAASGSAARVASSVALRDRSGVLLAQAAPGGTNPVALTIAGGRTIPGPGDTLDVDLTLAPGADVRSFGLRLAGATDVVAVDPVTGAPATVTGAGGAPFTPLNSRTITLFAHAHGYPNPFHAGREAVRLSYLLGADAPVRIKIYTLLGDIVREVAVAPGQPGGVRGLNEVPWDGRNGDGSLVRPGVYVARIEGAGVNETIKVGVLR